MHQDSLSSTSLVTDSLGAQVGSTVKYLPFGETRSTITVPTDKLFTGQRLDSTGLYYYNARYYDPTIGRFISADTIVPNMANPQCLNRYSYCLNNPLSLTDSNGHDPYWDLLALAALSQQQNTVVTEAAAAAAISYAWTSGINPNRASESPLLQIVSIPGEVLGGTGLYASTPISKVTIIDVGLAGKSGDTRYFHFDYHKIGDIKVDHFNATAGPLTKFNHHILPKGTKGALSTFTKAAPVISLVVDGYDIYSSV